MTATWEGIEARLKSGVVKIYEVLDDDGNPECAVFVLPAGSSADGRGVLSVSREMFPDVGEVRVFSGDSPDMIFQRLDDGWMAMDVREL